MRNIVTEERLDTVTVLNKTSIVGCSEVTYIYYHPLLFSASIRCQSTGSLMLVVLTWVVCIAYGFSSASTKQVSFSIQGAGFPFGQTLHLPPPNNDPIRFCRRSLLLELLGCGMRKTSVAI